MIVKSVSVYQEFREISVFNANILQDCYDSYINKIESDEIRRAMTICFEQICRKVNSSNVQRFTSWNEDMLRAHLGNISVPDEYHELLEELVERILTSAGCLIDLDFIHKLYDSQPKRQTGRKVITTKAVHKHRATEKERSFDVRGLYPHICEDNAAVIEEYFTKDILPVESNATYNSRYAYLNVICKQINDDDVYKFSQWDEAAVKHYIDFSSHGHSAVLLIIKIVTGLLRTAGNDTDLSDIDTNSLMSYKGDFVTFGYMNGQLRNQVLTSLQLRGNWLTMNRYSNPIIACYLSWLGVRRLEMPTLKVWDYDAVTKTLSFVRDGENISVYIDEPDIRDYFEAYIKSETYTGYCEDGKERVYNYRPGDTFLKSGTSKSKGISNIADNAIRALSRELGISAQEVWEAGRLDEMYIMDIRGVEITMKNRHEIYRRLNIKAPKGSTHANSEVGKLILQYPTYKERREDIINKQRKK